MSDFYQRLRRKIRAWAKTKTAQDSKALEYVLLAPDFFHLLVRLAGDGRVSWTSKAMLGGVIAYFVSPLDIIPEGILGPGGYVDDVILAALAVRQVVKSAGAQVVEAHWAGDGDILHQVEELYAKAEDLIGPPRWQKLLDTFAILGGKRRRRGKRGKRPAPAREPAPGAPAKKPAAREPTATRDRGQRPNPARRKDASRATTARSKGKGAAKPRKRRRPKRR